MAERERDDELEQSTTRWMTVGVILTAVFAFMFPLYRLYEPTGRTEARTDLEASLASQGADLYQASCASCHGVDGEGVDAPALNSQQFLEAADDEQIASLIAHGIPGTEMSAYSLDFGGFLTSEQIEAVSTYLRSLEADAPDRPDWRFLTFTDGHDDEPDQEEPADHDESPTDEPPPGDEEGAAADEPVAFDAVAAFANSCASCHGPDMRGTTGPPAAPPLGPTSHSLTEPDEHLIEAIAFGRDEMPAFVDELTTEEIEEIVRYIRQVQAGN